MLPEMDEISLMLCFRHDMRYVISQLNMTIPLFNYQINVQLVGQIASYIFVATQGKSGAALETLSVAFITSAKTMPFIFLFNLKLNGLSKKKQTKNSNLEIFFFRLKNHAD